MKIFVSALISALALTGLTGCAEKIPAKYADGKVVGCNDIKIEGNAGMQVPCLGDATLINLESLRGPMLLNVWGSWCAPCKDEIPYLRHFYDKYKGKVQIVGLDVEEPNKNAPKPFIKLNGITWPILIDPDGRTRKLIGMGVPVTWFIDETGKVIYKKVGVFTDYKELEQSAKKYFNLN